MRSNSLFHLLSLTLLLHYSIGYFEMILESEMAEIAKPKEFNNVRKRVLKLKTNIVVTSERIKVVILSVFLV